MDIVASPCEIIQRAFPGIHDREAEELSKSGKISTYPIHTVLCRENAIEDIFYIVLDGEVQVTKSINDSETRLMKTLKAGDFFGEMALIHNAPRAATITTITPVTVLEINKETFNSLLWKNSNVSMAMVKEMSRRLRENDAMAIEDLRLKARELADAYQQLAELEYARSEFLTTIAHELRTPLTAASGFLQIIRLGIVQGEGLNSALETVSRNIQEIISLVNNILFLQEMEMILPEFQPTDIGAVVASAIEQQRSHAKRNQVGLSISIAPDIPRIPANAPGLERAITALLDNAIKFSPDGGEVRISLNASAGRVCVSVSDTGVGIPDDALPQIFDRFFHIEQLSGHLFRGVGLGLSVARQVIEQHGGVIEVQSELGKGSTFQILLNQ